MQPDELQSAIDRHVMSLPDFTRSFELRMSTAGFCQRQMDYYFRDGKAPVTLAQAMRLLTGEPIHEFYRKTFTAIFGDDFQFAEAELFVPLLVDGEEYQIKGHPDGYLASANAVIEVKSVSEATFRYVQGQGSPIQAHYEQANVYADALRAESILFVYHNRNDGNYLVLMAPHSDELFDKTTEKWAQVIRNRRTGALSPRPYHDATSSPCFYCEFKERCYEGYGEQIAGGKVEVVSDPEFCGVAARYRMARRSKLHSEKEEDKAKAELAKLMLERGLKLAALAWGEVSLKAGKNNNPLVGIKEKT